MSNKDDRRCLLLNADYSPICLVSWHKSISWSIRYNTNVEILYYFSDKYIIGVDNKQYQLPMVARIKRFINLHIKKIKFSRHNVFLRDNYMCQYCGICLSPNQLTYDHVIPKSILRNKKATHWHNVVTCCLRCNAKKGNKTPDQANMRLIKSPTEPTDKIKYLPITRELSIIKEDIPEQWKQFIHTKFI